jgi:Family of unknown function (DUF6622)
MIVQILQHTPVWVWMLLAALLYFGYLQSRTRAVPKERLFALPAAMLGLSLYSLFATFGATRLGFVAWLAGGILAALLYRVFGRPAGTAYAPDMRVYTVPGSWLPLTLMLAIFVTRYAVAVMIAIDASLRQASSFVLVAGLVYGFLSCTFTARAHAAVRAARHAPPSMAAQSA